MTEKVLITGASRGIGRSIATAFAKEGYDLILTCRENISLLNEFSAELESTYKVKVSAAAVDVSDYDAVKGLSEMCGDIDILINNAGIAWMGLLTDMEKAAMIKAQMMHLFIIDFDSNKEDKCL